MRKKWPLFLGIVLLTIGIILKKTTDLNLAAIVCMTVGVSLKVYYIGEQARKGIYEVGYEMVALLVGLVLFFTGLYLKLTGSDFPHLWLMIPGISLKVLFIVLFIRKTRKVKSTQQVDLY